MASNVSMFMAMALGATALMSVIQVRRRIIKSDRREKRLRALLREQSGAIRALARESVYLRRQYVSLTLEASGLDRECEDVREKISEAE